MAAWRLTVLTAPTKRREAASVAVPGSPVVFGRRYPAPWFSAGSGSAEEGEGHAHRWICIPNLRATALGWARGYGTTTWRGRLRPSERSGHSWRRKQSRAAVSDVSAAERLSQHERVARLCRAVGVNGLGSMPGAQRTGLRGQPTAADRAGLPPVSADTLAEGVARQPDGVAVPCSHDAGLIVRSRACVLSGTVVGAHPPSPGASCCC